MTDAAALFGFLLDRRRRGEDAALVTLVGVVGGGARSPGAQMAVGADGGVLGSFTAGCADAAVVAEARDAMRAGRARTVRFGVDSPYMDIRLPCGGGIDLLFTPGPSLAALERAAALLADRRPVAQQLSVDGGMTVVAADDDDRTGWDGAGFRCRLEPRLRLLVAGHGAEPLALLRLGRGIEAEASLLSPDADCLAAATSMGVPADRLHPGFRLDELRIDARTAAVLLFHDHEWETRILQRAIASRAFFIGAMGSRRTHAERCRRLAAAGATPGDLARIIGPVGLIEAARDPETLAVSVLAQVMAEQVRALRAGADAPPVGSAAPERSASVAA
ncbi:MAG: XdhC family protein [Gluconacetobacter diazotrophicus]|nr:XdhC family protein [Gluconacetobacter diazotrophicus]